MSAAVATSRKRLREDDGFLSYFQPFRHSWHAILGVKSFEESQGNAELRRTDEGNYYLSVFGKIDPEWLINALHTADRPVSLVWFTSMPLPNGMPRLAALATDVDVLTRSQATADFVNVTNVRSQADVDALADWLPSATPHTLWINCCSQLVIAPSRPFEVTELSFCSKSRPRLDKVLSDSCRKVSFDTPAYPSVRNLLFFEHLQVTVNSFRSDDDRAVRDILPFSIFERDGNRATHLQSAIITTVSTLLTDASSDADDGSAWLRVAKNCYLPLIASLL